MNSTLFFGRKCLDALTRAARESPRLRRNLNFHESDTHPANRLLNAVEPESYVRPHRHLRRHKEETFVAVRGAFGVLLFDEHGNVTHSEIIRAGGELIGAHIPTGIFHTLVAIEPGSAFFEVKAGPYRPIDEKEWPSWAPTEDDPSAPAYLARLRALFA